MVKDNIKQKINEYISVNFMIGRENEELREDDPLISSGIIDSFRMIELISYIETEWNISIPDEKIGQEYFESVGKIIEFIVSITGC